MNFSKYFGFIFAFLLFILLVSPAKASAQTTTLFTDSFENGSQGWLTEGTSSGSLWHLSERKAASPTHAWYYGREDTGNYETGNINHGTVTSPQITVPSGVDNVTLHFNQFLNTENIATSTGSIISDRATVEVSNDNGQSWNVLGTFRSTNDWVGVYSSIPSYYLGPAIQIRFKFDTVNSFNNTYEGWYVDDVEITATQTTPSCDLPATVSLTNSTTAQIYPGQTVNNEFAVTNPNDPSCSATLYGISRGYPAGWSLSSPYSVTVNAGETVNIPFSVTASSSATPGTYSYTLYANGAAGATGYVEILNTPPVANAGVDQNAFTNATVSFDGSLSSDREGAINYLWNFGDGATSTGRTPTHTFTVVGVYTVTLTVTDTEGLTATDSLFVTVQNDTVSITKAVFSTSKKQLTIEATSSSYGGSVLTVQGIGQMFYDPTTKLYRLIKTQGYVSSVTVQSSFGGANTSSVIKIAK
jgi:PKD repeat protein